MADATFETCLECKCVDLGMMLYSQCAVLSVHSALWPGAIDRDNVTLSS